MSAFQSHVEDSPYLRSNSWARPAAKASRSERYWVFRDWCETSRSSFLISLSSSFTKSLTEGWDSARFSSAIFRKSLSMFIVIQLLLYQWLAWVSAVCSSFNECDSLLDSLGLSCFWVDCRPVHRALWTLSTSPAVYRAWCRSGPAHCLWSRSTHVDQHS